MRRATALVLPRLSREEARAARARFAPRVALTLPGFEMRLRIDPTAPGPCGPAPMRMILTWGDRRFSARCPRALAAEAWGRSGTDIDLDGIDPALAALLTEAALLADIEAVERATGRDIRLLPAAGEPRFSTDDDELHLVVEKGERRWSVGLSSESGGRQAVAELLSHWPVAPRAMDGLPFPAALRLGSTPLTAGQVRSLGPDDAILFATERTGGGMLVIAESWLAEAVRQGTAWRLDVALRPARTRDEKEWTMTDEDVELRRETPVGDPDDIPVRLAFDVGRLEVSLGELRRLGAGSVLDLGRTPEELVRITANGRLVGQGTLVEIDGAVGVRIVRMFDVG